MGDDLISMITDFFEKGELPKVVNTIWVALIPKVEGAVELKDFRPISVVGCIYKVIAKIMALRLKRMIPFLIGETQSAFVMERQIMDGALIANEVVQWAMKKKEKIVLLKPDFQKAYDTINYSFVQHLWN